MKSVGLTNSSQERHYGLRLRRRQQNDWFNENLMMLYAFGDDGKIIGFKKTTLCFTLSAMTSKAHGYWFKVKQRLFMNRI